MVDVRICVEFNPSSTTTFANAKCTSHVYRIPHTLSPTTSHRSSPPQSFTVPLPSPIINNRSKLKPLPPPPPLLPLREKRGFLQGPNLPIGRHHPAFLLLLPPPLQSGYHDMFNMPGTLVLHDGWFAVLEDSEEEGGDIWFAMERGEGGC